MPFGRAVTTATLLVATSLTACSRGPTFQAEGNAATKAAVNEAAANISQTDGASADLGPIDAAGVGDSMRKASAKPPPS